MRMLFGSLLMAYVLGVVLPIPTAARVDIGINIGIPAPPPIVITAPPRLVVVPGTAVSYAPALPHNYFFYGRRYYVLHQGAWFFAPAHHGPWTFIAPERVPRPLLRVPVAYYRVPPGHLKKAGRGIPPGHFNQEGRGRGQKHKKYKGGD